MKGSERGGDELSQVTCIYELFRVRIRSSISI